MLTRLTSMNEECRVLVVDDDTDTREALTEALTGAGFLVEQARGGHEALLQIGAKGPPDVILLDLFMPEMNGEELLEKLRGCKSRVIVLTGDSSTRLLSFANEAKLLRKPVGLDELEAAVKEACAAA
jgi:DNA-binding response OmpR family regulator